MVDIGVHNTLDELPFLVRNKSGPFTKDLLTYSVYILTYLYDS